MVHGACLARSTPVFQHEPRIYEWYCFTADIIIHYNKINWMLREHIYWLRRAILSLYEMVIMAMFVFEWTVLGPKQKCLLTCYGYSHWATIFMNEMPPFVNEQSIYTLFCVIKWLSFIGPFGLTLSALLSEWNMRNILDDFSCVMFVWIASSYDAFKSNTREWHFRI